MKAKVYYRDYHFGVTPDTKATPRSKTIEVSKNEVNTIVEEFMKALPYRYPTEIYITHIRCGQYDYQWHAYAAEAFRTLPYGGYDFSSLNNR